MNAEAEGRLIVLPCKFGEYLYAPTRNIISKFKIRYFEVFSQKHAGIRWELCDGIYGKMPINGIISSEIGKTVFLTLEEAEKALEEVQE